MQAGEPFGVRLQEILGRNLMIVSGTRPAAIAPGF
jgi:hypothetical protein